MPATAPRPGPMKKISEIAMFGLMPTSDAVFRVLGHRPNSHAEIGAVHEEFETDHQHHGDEEDGDLLVTDDGAENVDDPRRQEGGVESAAGGRRSASPRSESHRHAECGEHRRGARCRAAGGRRRSRR